ncbi:MAG TPA: GMP synthase [Bacteroidia bacterium]|nr:GMP synthase [Bacteroidia bacterium]QQR94888.1 MAG: GMP synthase [Bacteroidota bacterium]MBP7715327.1 GMP synthase [Bacteroidia bacterium]MBP8668993.1 GMP synthase [Bacteroidia bacterium]HOZ83052.1 GMP synthase [Bacteroidia bacterium]
MTNFIPVRVAVLDLYNGEPNEGMRSIRSILERFSKFTVCSFFDVRQKNEVPDLSFDIYISSGGPGCPLPAGEEWEEPFYALWDKLIEHNADTENKKKYAFLICHSFQMMAHHLGFGVVSERHSPSFGIFPIHKTDDGNNDRIIGRLPEPFYAVDSREWQVTTPDLDKIVHSGGKLLCLEKMRPHVPYERAIMGLRFSDEILGVQFHPEADAEGMYRYFDRPDKKEKIMELYGSEKYYDMIESLSDPNKIELTHHAIIPCFLADAIEHLYPQLKMQKATV